MTTRVGRYQKCKTNLDFTEARDSEWQSHQLGHMQVCTLLQTDNHTSTPPLSMNITTSAFKWVKMQIPTLVWWFTSIFLSYLFACDLTFTICDYDTVAFFDYKYCCNTPHINTRFNQSTMQLIASHMTILNDGHKHGYRISTLRGLLVYVLTFAGTSLQCSVTRAQGCKQLPQSMQSCPDQQSNSQPLDRKSKLATNCSIAVQNMVMSSDEIMITQPCSVCRYGATAWAQLMWN